MQIRYYTARPPRKTEIQVKIAARTPQPVGFFLYSVLNRNVYRTTYTETGKRSVYEGFFILPDSQYYQVVLQPVGGKITTVVARPPHFNTCIAEAEVTVDVTSSVSLGFGRFAFKMPRGFRKRLRFQSFSVLLENETAYYQNGPFALQCFVDSGVGDITLETIEFDCQRIVYFYCDFTVLFKRDDQLKQGFFAKHTPKAVTNLEQLNEFTRSNKKYTNFCRASSVVDYELSFRLDFIKYQTSGDIISRGYRLLLSVKAIEKSDIEPLRINSRRYYLDDQAFELLTENTAAFLPQEDFFCYNCDDLEDAARQDLYRIQYYLETDTACFELPSGNRGISKLVSSKADSYLEPRQSKYLPAIRRRAVVNVGCQVDNVEMQSYEYKKTYISYELFYLADEFSQVWDEDIEICANTQPKTSEYEAFRATECLRHLRNGYIQSVYRSPCCSVGDSSQSFLSEIQSTTSGKCVAERTSRLHSSAIDSSAHSFYRKSKIPILSKNSAQYLAPERKVCSQLGGIPARDLGVEDLDDGADIQRYLEESRMRVQQIASKYGAQ